MREEPKEMDNVNLSVLSLLRSIQFVAILESIYTQTKDSWKYEIYTQLRIVYGGSTNSQWGFPVTGKEKKWWFYENTLLYKVSLWIKTVTICLKRKFKSAL